MPLFTSQRADLLDVPRLRAQLVGLERRRRAGGRDTVDHAPGGHDDVANACVGALVQASATGSCVVLGGDRHDDAAPLRIRAAIRAEFGRLRSARDYPLY